MKELTFFECLQKSIKKMDSNFPPSFGLKTSEKHLNETTYNVGILGWEVARLFGDCTCTGIDGLAKKNSSSGCLFFEKKEGHVFLRKTFPSDVSEDIHF